MHGNRGAALLTAIVMALLISIAAGTIFLMSTHQAEMTGETVEHKVALYLSQAGTVLAHNGIQDGGLVGGAFDMGATHRLVGVRATGPPPDLAVIPEALFNTSLHVRIGLVVISAEGVTTESGAPLPNSRSVEVIIDPEGELTHLGSSVTDVTDPDGFRAYM
ncbi:MAG: hypothetical protein HYY14_00225 [Candidatus Omnitrophica bacterium]|nr:hypothetical protein [Candidatus Omnitrophota bacterium]